MWMLGGIFKSQYMPNISATHIKIIESQAQSINYKFVHL